MTLSSLRAPETARTDRFEPVRLTVAAPAAEPAPGPLALIGVSKRWSSGQPPVLDDINLTLEAGTMTWIGGRNGVGKTTLLRIAAGLIFPEQGRAEVWGLEARQNRGHYQRLVSFLSAGDRGLYARITVRAHLEFWARIAMLPNEGLCSLIEETIDAFQLRPLAARRVDRMSMGQRQRLRIAMTFLPRPQVVLLDEPLNSLDVDGEQLLASATTQLRARGGAVLWCSPSMDSRARFDARWALEHGRLVPA